MKRNIYIQLFCLVLIMIGTTGCEKLLEEEPKATISLGELNPVLLDQTIIGVYEPLTRSRGRLWESRLGLYLELMSDYADGGASQKASSDYTNLLMSPNSLEPTWVCIYEAVGKANLLLANLDANTSLSDDQKSRAYGEAYFIRALCYYNIVRIWGKVPLRLKPIVNSDDVDLPLSEIPEIYDAVIKDLKIAEVNLPAQVPSANAGRATSGAAKVMLADVYLTLKDYTNARDKAKEVIDNKATYGYDLEPSLATLYSPVLATNKEDVFSLKFSQVVGAGSFWASYWADSKAKLAGYSVTGNKFGGIMSKAPIIAGWDNNDLRKQFSLYSTYIINGVVTNAEVEANNYDLRMGKYKDPNAPADTGNGNDFYFYRYADALLIFAEAENKLNGPVNAYAAINQVRRRAYGVSLAVSSTVADLPAGLSQLQFDELVLRERAYEFIGECKRWFDMVRTDKVAEILTGVRAAIPTPARKPIPTKFVFGIPDIELQNNSLAR
ncbi:hypothetical protein ADIARSV_4189 [Arcticibacter svalbardensis MN12-7]|uniref:Outer membrane protein n=1 Tax=Arcticibacter svalbardensis MN12-7 TaxID=1150600 RepID=R9GLI8_9SPHI|nr:RagB/SusD family nutrient uptake outer membrane protein [Arcticibacter svalbardensis]EOR92677.1 hypothetical protein ADIARSV_4189 [Arcticibacter svalbardensis MN12-7]